MLAAALMVAVVSAGPAATTGTLDLPKSAAAFGPGVTYVLALLLAMAMGIQNSAARKLAVPDLTTTVLTMTLTGIGADSPSGHRGHVTLVRRVLAVAVMLAGGALGAWLVLNVGVVVPLALAAGLLAMVAASAVLASRKSAQWRPVAPARPVTPSAQVPSPALGR